MGSDSWKTWAAVFALIIFAGVASAAWPFISDQLAGESRLEPELEQEPITIQVEDYVLGSDLLAIEFIKENVDGLQFTQFQGLAVLVGIVLVLTGATGVPLALIYARLGSQVEKTYESDEFQEALSRLNDQEEEKVKALRQGHPESSATSDEGRWPVYGTALVILLFVWLLGTMLGKELFDDAETVIGGMLIDPVSIFSLVLVLISAVILYLVFRTRSAAELESPESDYWPVNWGTVWVILSGMLVVGVGTGLALALRATG